MSIPHLRLQPPLSSRTPSLENMLSDWESSLTEFSSDEDAFVPAPKKKAPPKVKNEYKVSCSHASMIFA